MPRRRVALRLVIALTLLVVLAATASAWAHGVPSGARFHDASASRDDLTSAAGARGDGLPRSLPATILVPPKFPWPVLLVGLVGIAFGAHRRRRALALALALLLVSFAFEVGLHSVHHGADLRQIAACAAAAASVHLAATPVDGVISVEAILPAVASTPELDPSRPLTCSIRPDQGRAPPA